MSAPKLFPDTLKNKLKCSICQDIFTDPKTLPCQHTYCRRCIVSWPGKMNCPNCKTHINVRDGDPSNLPSSFYLNSLLQFYLLHTKKNEANKQGLSDCVCCEKPRVLVAFCPQCNGLICGECENAHKTLKQFRTEHQPTMLDDFEQENVDNFIRNQMLCKEKFHEKNKLEYFCQEETCKRCICQKCFALFHREHRVQRLEEAKEDAKQAIQKIMERAKHLREEYELELEQSQENRERIKNEIDLAKKDVHVEEERICKMTRDHTTEMIDSLDETLREQTTSNHDEQSVIQTDIQQVYDFEYHCQTLLERNFGFEMMESKEGLHVRCESLTETPSIWSSKPIHQDVTVYYAMTKQVMQSLPDIGKIVKINLSLSTIESLKNGFSDNLINEFEIITRNTEGEVCPTKTEFIDVRITDVKGNEVENIIFDEKSGKKHVSFKAEEVGPCEVQVNIRGKPIKNSPQTVNLLDVEQFFKPVKAFGQRGRSNGELYHPRSIAASDNGEMAIAVWGNHCIQIFSLDGKYLREFGKQGSGEGQLNHPFGVVFNKDRIIVSDSPDHKGRIQEFELNGTYVRTIYRSEQWFVPRGMCVDDDKNIAVCCLGNKDLSIKPSIKVFGKQGVNEFYMLEYNEQPLYVSYSNGKYFASYIGKNYVGVFHENGDFSHIFGGKGEMDGQFNGVSGLAVYGSDMMLVCDCSNDRVQLLTQEGQFIRSFGSHGSGVGQIDGPTDVVVADGRVFVLEFGGDRVGVWG